MGGAIAGLASIVAAMTLHPILSLDMDRDLPPFVSGVYPPERAGDVTFAWTTARATIVLSDLDRRSLWTCSLRVRGGHPRPPQPAVAVAVDGVVGTSRVATNEYQEISITIPPRPRGGAVVTVSASPTFVPGVEDPRHLGVQVDRLHCEPDGGRLVLPPWSVLVAATTAAAVAGASLGLARVAAGGAAAGTVLVAIAQAIPLSWGPAPYTGHASAALRLAVWIALALVGAVRVAEGRLGTLRSGDRFALAFSAAALYLKLLVLLHPSKPLVDAVFHAHRLEWVLAGRYFFTQQMPGGVEFPYAIGLYVAAAPWTWLTADYVTLLRVVVGVADAIAGIFLYLMVVRVWDDRGAGAVAVVLYTVTPVAYWVIGNANLTSAFAQSVALSAVAAAVTLPFRRHRSRDVAALAALAALAFLSHVSTFPLLAATLGLLVGLYRFAGGPSLRQPAWLVLVATSLALLLAIATYYGRFGQVYRRALRVSGQAAKVTPPPRVPSEGDPKSRFVVPLPFPARARDGLALTGQAVGWPILGLAAAGAWGVWRRRTADRLTLAVVAWGGAYFVFLGVGLMRVDVPYQRYAHEFIGRVVLATYPAAVILGGRSAAWAWRAGGWKRLAAAVLVLLAVADGVRSWLGWLG